MDILKILLFIAITGLYLYFRARKLKQLGDEMKPEEEPEDLPPLEEMVKELRGEKQKTVETTESTPTQSPSKKHKYKREKDIKKAPVRKIETLETIPTNQQSFPSQEGYKDFTTIVSEITPQITTEQSDYYVSQQKSTEDYSEAYEMKKGAAMVLDRLQDYNHPLKNAIVWSIILENPEERWRKEPFYYY